MIIFCNGLAKSGSSFIFQITESLAQAAGFNQSELRKKYIPINFIPYKPHPHFVSIPSNTIYEWAHEVPESILLVIKTHAPYSLESAKLLQSKTIKVINSYRDPREAAVSLWDARLKEIMTTDAQEYHRFDVPSFLHAILTIANRANANSGWLHNTNALNIGFPEIIEQPFIAANSISKYLGLNIDSFPIVSRYLINRESIHEYNIGIPGRYRTYMSQFEAGLSNRLYQKYDKLMEIISSCRDY